MTIPAFCRWAGIGRTMAYAQAKAGHLKFRKVGAKKTIVLRADAEEWLRSLPAASS
ncbi:helix-turn-helix transcriptional regulator [Bradyrhizobium sp. SZCCHNR2026]|nr:DNA-binding protein [Bradyrhizobium sp. SZCCHNR2026]